jgi:hypothetical protein
MYSLNVLNEEIDDETFYDAETGDEEKKVPENPEPEIIPSESDRPQIQIVELFGEIIRWTSK